MYEIPILKAWVGNTIVGIDVRKKYNINIIAIKHGDELRATPGPNYVFREDDHIMVLGRSSDVFKLASKA